MAGKTTLSAPRAARTLALLVPAIVLALHLTGQQGPGRAQTDCGGYNSCPALQTVSPVNLPGEIRYSFDDAALNTAFGGDAAAIQDFKSRITAAANDWAAKTGRSIAPAAAGQRGNVTITVSGSPEIQAVDGLVDIDRADSSRRIITFSDEFDDWSAAGRDRMSSHEWGHVLGLRDVDPDDCPGVETVMRRNGPGSNEAELQLRQGYTCEVVSNTTFGDPNGCAAASKLKQPPRPNACDEAKSESFNPTPAPTPDPITESCVWRSCGTGFQWSAYECACVVKRTPTQEGWSPILVDTDGDGFDLTGAGNGVHFDLNGDGVKETLGWTSVNSDDAWLALDRDGDGLITSGRELFGNFTEQPPPPPGEDLNGFLALAEFDGPERGGNSDGVIDAGDAVFPALRLWRDADHDGLSGPGELHALPALGVAGLQLRYRESKKADEHGNLFRYRAKVWGGRESEAGRWAWDVFLVPAP